MIHDASPEARGGVMRAAMSRHDVAWLRAMIAHGSGGALLKHLPPAEAAEQAVTSLAQVRSYDLVATLDALPGPWSRRLADAVLDRLQAEKQPADVVGATLPLLAERLPADVLPRLRRWAGTDGAPRLLVDLVQYLSFVPAIPEAFR
jgi:hypothetical protein